MKANDNHIKLAVDAIVYDLEVYRTSYAEHDGLVRDKEVKEHMRRLWLAVAILHGLNDE